MIAAAVLQFLLTLTYSTWLGACIFTDLARMFGWNPGYCRTIAIELKPFRWALVGVRELCWIYIHREMMDTTHLLTLGIDLTFCWYWGRKIDDDRWKRRRQKLADRVAEVAGRLIIVPQPA